MTDQKEYPEGHDRVISKGPCEKCGSRKGLVLYADGHSKCYGAGCDHFIAAPSDGSGSAPSGKDLKAEGSQVLEPDPQSWPNDGLKSRRIQLDTMRKFGVFLASFNGGRVQAYPYYNQQGQLAGQKLRTASKDFPFVKNGEEYQQLGQCQLFGRHVFGDRFDRTVVVTEGELDAMSVAQETDFKIAAVSVNSGAGSAAKVLKANYLWLDRFEEIILWFDDDEPGREATEECAKLFKVGKVRVARHGVYKDASDCLQHNKPGDIKTTIYAATKWRPKGIVNAADNVEDVLAPTEDDAMFRYEWPWKPLTDYFGYILPGQVVYNVAGTGVGKTTFLYHLLLHLVTQGAKIAVFSFEGTRREVKLGLLTVAEGKRLDIEPLPDDDMRRVHELYFGNKAIELFDPETAEWSMEAIEGYVRYCAKALDCQVMLIDPLSYVVAGMDQSADERRALDMVSRNLAGMAKELGINLQVSHHLSRPSQGPGHEEGGATSLNHIRGSGGIAAFATIVIGHERNQQAEEDGSLITQLRSLKNRPRSKTGIVMTVEYSIETGRLEPTSKPFPSPGAGKSKSENADTPFRSVGEGDY